MFRESKGKTMAIPQDTDNSVSNDLSDEALEEAGKAMIAELGMESADDRDHAAPAEDDADPPENDTPPAKPSAKAAPAKDADADDDEDGDKPKGKSKDFEPGEERKLESVNALWAEARRAKKAAKQESQELAAQRAELERERAEVAEQRKLAALMRDNPREGFAKYARANGLDPTQFYQELTEAHLKEGGGDAPAALTRKLAEMERQQKEWREQQEARVQQSQQRSQQTFLRQRIDELMSVKEHDALAKMHPYLATMPAKKLQEEVTNCVLWLAQNDPGALNDSLALAKMLDDAAKVELESWNENRKRFSTQAHDAPAKASATGNGDPVKPSPAISTTITNADESAHGGARELDDDERYERAGKLAAKLLQVGD